MHSIFASSEVRSEVSCRRGNLKFRGYFEQNFTTFFKSARKLTVQLENSNDVNPQSNMSYTLRLK